MGIDVRKLDRIDAPGAPTPEPLKDNPYADLIRDGKIGGPGYARGPDGREHFFYCNYESPKTVSKGG